ncbi:transcriptional repressor [Nocardia mexicana]|uniref:transcriptional repressor n=1 Tax=Nocardia mexicana TaxID=279262 RepID=UPI000A020323|nr:transcriptional repressor [Nocardia mexicana]
MPPDDHWSASPKPVRYRATVRVTAMLDVLRRDDRFRSAQQLYDDLRTATSLRIGPTTVYRILNLLVEQELVETQRSEAGELMRSSEPK